MAAVRNGGYGLGMWPMFSFKKSVVCNSPIKTFIYQIVILILKPVGTLKLWSPASLKITLKPLNYYDYFI